MYSGERSLTIIELVLDSFLSLAVAKGPAFIYPPPQHITYCPV
jgi:hypothetical protein